MQDIAGVVSAELAAAVAVSVPDGPEGGVQAGAAQDDESGPLVVEQSEQVEGVVHSVGAAPGNAIPYTMAEVRGFSGTLEQAIAAGEVPNPPPMPFHEWQRWRAREGRCLRRPILVLTGAYGIDMNEARRVFARIEYQLFLRIMSRYTQEVQANLGPPRLSMIPS